MQIFNPHNRPCEQQSVAVRMTRVHFQCRAVTSVVGDADQNCALRLLPTLRGQDEDVSENSFADWQCGQ